MAKYLKRYNKKTQKWEIISGGETTVIQTIDSGTPIYDKNITVTSESYTEYAGNDALKLNETLGVIDNNIKKLQRNVSWLAEHGGGGGGNGTGGNSSYGIVVVSPLIENNAVYVTEDSLTIKFRITGGTESDTFRYRYTLDGVNTTSYVAVNNDELITINIPSLSKLSSSTMHTVLIEALNPYGLNMPPLNFRIYESSLKLSIDKNRNNISNGEILLPMNDLTGYIYFNIKNGVERSQTTLHVECNNVSSAITYENETTDETSVPFSFWDIMEKQDVITNGRYTIGYYAQATLGTSVNNKTEMAYFDVRITNPNEMSIYLDGVSYASTEESAVFTEIEQNDKLTFNFKVYLPVNVTNNAIRYALWLMSPNNEKYELFDTSDSDATSATTTLQNYANQSIPIQVPLSSYEISDGWKIYVKAWSYNGSLTAQTIGQFNIIRPNTAIYPRQFPKRTIVGNYSADTCLFAWDSSSRWNNKESKLVSKVVGYSPCIIAAEHITTEADLKTFNIDGVNSGYIIPSDESPSYIRLQNEAYAIADMSGYKGELDYMTNPNSSGDGFTMSVTFKSDEHTDADKTVFLWGANNNDGTLFNGCKITLESASWFIHNSKGEAETISTSLRQGKKNTVDFVYNNGICMILVNGIINASYDAGTFDPADNYRFPSEAYFACDFINNACKKFSDINLYECAFYTKALNGLQLAVNGKNARLDGPISNKDVLNDYTEWKRKSLIYNTEDKPEKALSYLIDAKGNYNYDSGITATMRANSPIPSIFIDATNSNFTEDFFHTDYAGDKSVTGIPHECRVEYYDPATKASISFNALIYLQGTSTLGYYIKNLEMKVNERCTLSGEENKYKLFQPKDTWFPEREFTLKADVVDSAHANNATIGYWINHECNIMENNPAMEAMTDDYRPKDRAFPDENHLHTDSRNGTDEINYDEKVTIKHTLEGFPVLLFIRFDKSNSFDLIGIYSFNLGRFSYYNMGLSFLKEYSRRAPDNPSLEVDCPALVDHYVEYGRNEIFNGIKLSDIYSYEFDAGADDNDPEHQTWTQSDKTILRHYGSFRFNGENPEESVSNSAPIWDKMSNLFYKTATMGSSTGGWLSQHGLEGKQMYYFDEKANKYVLKGSDNRYVTTSDNMANFNDTMSIRNAVSYYTIVMGLGMVDSLGKNLTIRTWNGGNKWWTAFYDMDSALQLGNEGSENIAATAGIDTFENKTEENSTTQLIQNFFVVGGGYNAYYSKLWAIFRADEFLYATASAYTYDKTWVELRQTGGALSTVDKFVNLMEKQIGSCGELIYNYDYHSKYIDPKQNLQMLHGLRIENVRKWLKNRLYYLDGVFEVPDSAGGNFEDAPYYKNTFNITNKGHDGGAIGYIPYTFRSVAPTFIRINTGNEAGLTETSGKYFLPAYTDTVIHTSEHTSQKQTNFTSSLLLTKIDGLDGIQPVNMNTNNNAANGVLPALTSLEISGAKYLDNKPTDFAIFRYKNEGALEKIDLSKTQFANDTSDSFVVDCSQLTKVKYIDISHSPVTSLVLPSSILQVLRVSYSNITHFNMRNQPILKTIDFTACNRLQTINIENCNGLESLTIGGESGLTILNSINIQNCASLSSITINNNEALATVSINNCENLKEITITKCTSKNLAISVLGCPLVKINMSKLESMTTPMVLPSADMLSGVTSFDISNNFKFGGIKYGNTAELETIGGDYVLDLSVFPLLTGINDASINNITTLKYVRVKNVENDPFNLYSSFFGGVSQLKRIFGHVCLREGGVFNRLNNFYVNTEVTPAIFEEPVFNSGKNYTNITIDTESLAHAFRETSCSLSDLYYIMHKVNEKVVDLSWAFTDCKNMETKLGGQQLDKNLFKNCINVKNIDYMFFGSKIGGLLDNELLSPLTKLTSFSNVFPYESPIYVNFTDKQYFFPATNNITQIDNFNPYPYVTTGTYVAFPDGNLLHNLPNIERISRSFNQPCNINFDRDGSLLGNCKKLKEIFESFQQVMGYAVTKPITNIFGAQEGLESVKNSFIFGENDYSDMTISIGNSFFGNVASTIKTIDGSFKGVGLKKVINYDDCNGENFPYEILTGCTKLETLSEFFSGISGKTDVVIDFPSETMFSKCTALTSFRKGFANVNIRYRLKADCFADNNITDFANAFEDGRGMREGMIPYHMFYQKAGNIITDMQGCFSNQGSKKLTPYSLSAETDEYIKKYIYVTENGENKWNEKFADGSELFKAKADAFKAANADLNLPTVYPETFIPNGQTDIDPTDFSMGIDNTNGIYDRLNTSNYFCPPDIFAYCKNDRDTIVDNCFAGIDRDNTEWIESGFFGRIPACIFAPLSNIVRLNGIFQGMHFTPTKWGVSENGTLVPPSLLSPCVNVQELQYMFASINVWGKTVYPADLFKSCKDLRNITGMWYNSRWFGNVSVGTSQIPNSMFQNSLSLIKVASLFARSNAILSGNLFSFQYNPKIYDVAYFLNQSNGSGTLIKWWNKWEIQFKDNCYTVVSPNNYSNYDECFDEAPSYFVNS